MSCLGSSYTVKATFTDEDGSLMDPDSHQILLLDTSEDTRGVETNPTKLSTGVFKATLPIPSDGKMGVWGICWSGVSDGESIPPKRFNFWVKEKC